MRERYRKSERAAFTPSAGPPIRVKAKRKNRRLAPVKRSSRASTTRLFHGLLYKRDRSELLLPRPRDLHHGHRPLEGIEGSA